MSYSVPMSFEIFRQNIEPPNYDRDTANTRKDHLISLLKSDFEILESFVTGSLPRYTAVKNYADLDIIVVLHYGKHIENKKPSEVLLSIKKFLSGNKTNLRRNGQAVTLYYKTWPNVDIVPVSRITNSDGLTKYYIPNMNNETWIPSQPKKHTQDLSSANSNFGVEFKRTVKMIKWWNHQHSSLLQSYHIEVLALKILTYASNDYTWKIYKFFDDSIDLVSSPLYHNLDIVDLYLDIGKRQEIIKRLKTARDKARNAWLLTYGNNDDHKNAIIIWKQIFGDKFPAYG